MAKIYVFGISSNQEKNYYSELFTLFTKFNENPISLNHNSENKGQIVFFLVSLENFSGNESF
jgi:hypothetical protein